MARADCATWRRAIDPRLTVIGSFKIWIGTQVRLPYRVIAMTNFFKTQMAGNWSTVGVTEHPRLDTTAIFWSWCCWRRPHHIRWVNLPCAFSAIC
jgi:hypothetical protein